MTTIRKILRDHGIRPLKRLGQSFLEDINIINKIISISNIQEDDTVVEIGAGVGIMTELIAEKVRKVIALDIDPRMVGILRERLAGYHQVDVIKGDVLKYDFLQWVMNYYRGKQRLSGISRTTFRHRYYFIY
jgi:16S rRNA (adenine1518-N6/adenine1519-N6)-dimethyltransferase